MPASRIGSFENSSMRLIAHTVCREHLKAVMLAATILCAGFLPSASAHDPSGQWAYLSNDLKEWFKSLHTGNRGTPCCEEADGQHVADVDWDTQKDDAGEIHYRVFLLGSWREVPNEAVITEPNRFGPAVVWPVYARGVSGQKEFSFIRCFLPGAGT
jgi:hypothetical protein